ncbi:MAG TPA: hypothetical protein VF743_06180 [Acidimicrobiales bacterium]
MVEGSHDDWFTDDGFRSFRRRLARRLVAVHGAFLVLWLLLLGILVAGDVPVPAVLVVMAVVSVGVEAVALRGVRSLLRDLSGLRPRVTAAGMSLQVWEPDPYDVRLAWDRVAAVRIGEVGGRPHLLVDPRDPADVAGDDPGRRAALDRIRERAGAPLALALRPGVDADAVAAAVARLSGGAVTVAAGA